jgi:hypothetical protein
VAVIDRAAARPVLVAAYQVIGGSVSDGREKNAASAAKRHYEA